MPPAIIPWGITPAGSAEQDESGDPDWHVPGAAAAWVAPYGDTDSYSSNSDAGTISTGSEAPSTASGWNDFRAAAPPRAVAPPSQAAAEVAWNGVEHDPWGAAPAAGYSAAATGGRLEDATEDDDYHDDMGGEFSDSSSSEEGAIFHPPLRSGAVMVAAIATDMVAEKTC